MGVTFILTRDELGKCPYGNMGADRQITLSSEGVSLPPPGLGRLSSKRLVPHPENAEIVRHATVLHCMSYAASHWTVMRKLISESGGWGNADEAQKAMRGQLGKQKQVVEMRIANYVKAIGDGRMSAALLSALDKAEVEKAEVVQ